MHAFISYIFMSNSHLHSRDLVRFETLCLAMGALDKEGHSRNIYLMRWCRKLVYSCIYGCYPPMLIETGFLTMKSGLIVYCSCYIKILWIRSYSGFAWQVIEISKGSKVKYELDKASGLIKVWSCSHFFCYFFFYPSR
jgi:hypothetical protein